MKLGKSVVGVGICVVPFFASADSKPHDEFTTVTQALEKITKNVSGSYSDFRKDIESMDKTWGTEALVYIYHNHKDAFSSPMAKANLLEGLIRLDQLSDPHVRAILTENKDNQQVGFWIVEKLQLDNSDAEKKARAVLQNYTDSTPNDEVSKAIVVLGNLQDGLVPYKDTLRKISQRNTKGDTSSHFAILFLGKMGDTEFLFSEFNAPNKTQSDRLKTLKALSSTNNIRNAIRQDKSRRDVLLKNFQSIMQKEKDPELRSLALKGITELLDYSRTDPGSDAEVRKFLNNVAESTTESQQIKARAAEALQRVVPKK